MIITISREYGSGGHEIGKKLADHLNFPFYDHELISMAAKDSGIRPEYFKLAEEIPASNFLYSLSILGSSKEVYGMPLNEKVYQVQSNMIKEVAEKGDCVIIGRCADYILRDKQNRISLFITSSFQNRVKRAIDQYHILPETAEKRVIKTDKSRQLYYEYHTEWKWGTPSNYDLVINRDRLNVENTVSLILSYLDLL